MDPRDLRQAFAANLRRLRHARGISQEDLAYEANINRTYLSKLEKGASYPGLEIIAKLATVLEVEPAALLRVPPECPKVCAAADDRVSHTSRTGSGARTASFSVGGARRVMLSNLRVGSAKQSVCQCPRGNVKSRISRDSGISVARREG